MGIPKEGVWHQLGEGQREKTTDKMDLRVNWDGCRQHLYSTIVHWIKWEKRGHVSRGCNLDQVNRAFYWARPMLMGGHTFLLPRIRRMTAFASRIYPQASERIETLIQMPNLSFRKGLVETSHYTTI